MIALIGPLVLVALPQVDWAAAAHRQSGKSVSVIINGAAADKGSFVRVYLVDGFDRVYISTVSFYPDDGGPSNFILSLTSVLDRYKPGPLARIELVAERHHDKAGLPAPKATYDRVRLKLNQK